LRAARNAPMIGRMKKLALVSTALFACLSGCGGPSETAKPPAAPASEVETAPPVPPAAETATPEIPGPPAAALQPRPSKEGKTETGQSGTALESNAPEKKGCAGLKKDTCKISLGCAWSTKGKGSCVEQ
jgi:hypothetical protein